MPLPSEPRFRQAGLPPEGRIAFGGFFYPGAVRSRSGVFFTKGAADRRNIFLLFWVVFH